MFDVLKTLSSLVKVKQVQVVKKPEKQQGAKTVPAKPVIVVDEKTEKQAQDIVVGAQSKAKEILVDAKEQAYKIVTHADEEARRKLEFVDRREKDIARKESEVEAKLQDSEVKRKKIQEILDKTEQKLESVSRMSKDEAKNILLNTLTSQLSETMAREIRDAENEARETAEAKAKEILIDAMKHGATEYVPEYTVSVIKIGDEEVKGRIIGKEGRNIRAFETATGVDVDLDEEGVIRLSCFDPVRREIARVTLERLLRDGRVQPGRIEDLVAQVKKELERIMFEEGQKLCHAVGVYNLPAPLIATLGKFKYRFSYGQNMIAHTMEETKIGIALAHEVGADVNIVRLGCLLHDIGKVIMDKEGNHIDLGVELLKKFGIPQKVVDCVAQHHEDIPFSSIESTLVFISDAISGSRPGARYENYDEYLKRLTDLEAIAKAHSGVKETFAFQAGRELRVVVEPESVSDDACTIMAREIKKEIEEKLTYPGQVKVTVVRELRVSEIAK